VIESHLATPNHTLLPQVFAEELVVNSVIELCKSHLATPNHTLLPQVLAEELLVPVALQGGMWTFAEAFLWSLWILHSNQ
jgi:hypothetical protein